MSGTLDLLLVRHPETLANAGRRFLGTQESPYTARGEAQRDALVAEIAAWRPDAIYSSPATRARVVAGAAASGHTPVTELGGLAEIDFGEAEGLTWDDTLARGIFIDQTGPGPVAPGGEAVAAFQERVSQAATMLRAQSGRVAIVTHAGVLRHLLCVLLDLPVEAGWRFALPNAVVVHVRLSNAHGVLVQLHPPAT